MSEILISARGLNKGFSTQQQGGVQVLQDVNLDVRENTFVALVGPSGCGKSTLLNLVAGLTFPSSGQLIYKGRPVDRINTDVGYVTQESKLFPWLTLKDNVSFPLEVRGLAAAEREQKVAEYLALVGLNGFEKHYPRQLSGGMQKRASIIRTLIYDPDVVLMDEPFGPLDAMTRMILQDELLRIWGLRQKTILFVTHDLVEAIALADLVVVFSHRPATVRTVVEVRVPRPRNVFEIHQMPGFAETYEELWGIFRQELKVG